MELEETVGEIAEEQMLLAAQNQRAHCSGFQIAGLPWALAA